MEDAPRVPHVPVVRVPLKFHQLRVRELREIDRLRLLRFADSTIVNAVNYPDRRVQPPAS